MPCEHCDEKDDEIRRLRGLLWERDQEVANLRAKYEPDDGQRPLSFPTGQIDLFGHAF